MVKKIIDFLLHRLTRAERAILIGVIVVASLGAFGQRYLWAQVHVVSPNTPSLGTTVVSNAHPVNIIFDRPVKRSTLRYALYPELPGTWSLKTETLKGRSSLTFTPAVTPELDTRYTIELSGISPLLGMHSQKYLLSFQTDTLPVFTSIAPAPAAIDVLPDSPVTISFDKKLSDNVIVTVAAVPEVLFEPGTIDQQTITFRHGEAYQKGTAYAIKAFLATATTDYKTGATTINEESKKEIAATNFTTVAAPGIASSVPSGSAVDPATTIQVVFQQAMDHASTEAAFSLAPLAAGVFSWPNEQTLVFTPTAPLVKAQAYTATVAATAKSLNGITLDSNFTFSFTTVGAVTVSSFNPSNGAKGTEVTTPITITFNQEVSHASAESKFSISPSVSGSFTWDGNAMVYRPSASLAHNTKYTVTIAAGVQAVKGLDSVAAFTTSFTTRSQSVLLSVPSYRQAHNYSCMIAAARSALAFRGVSVSEANIITRVGIDPTKWSGTWGGDDGRWGDPETAITGPLDNAAATSPAGKKTTNVYWGYGAHWGPIAKMMTSYGVANEVRTGMTVQQLAQSITDGNPVIIWWVNGIWPSYEVRWKTPSGKTIRGVNGLHVQVVRGFTGTVDNPAAFTVTDSGYGYPGKAYDIGTFKAKWGWFGNTGIIVK